MKKILPLLGLGCLGTPALDASVVQQELLDNVASIRQAQLDLLILGEFTPCSDESTALASASTVAREWTGTKCWSEIGWAPETSVHGGYWVELTKGDFIVTGVGPIMAQNQRVRVTATKDQIATVTP